MGHIEFFSQTKMGREIGTDTLLLLYIIYILYIHTYYTDLAGERRFRTAQYINILSIWSYRDEQDLHND